MFKSLRLSLFLCFSAVAVFGLVVFMMLAIPKVRSSAIDQIEGELKDQLMLASDDFSSAMLSGAKAPALQELAVSMSSRSGSRITLIAPDGNPIADSEETLSEVAKLGNHSDRPEIIEASRAGFGKAVRHSGTVSKDLIYVAMKLNDARGQTFGFLRFSVPTTYASASAMRIHKAVGFSIVASIIGALLLFVIFSKVFGDPIVKLSKATKAIADGDFSYSKLKKSRFEVGELEENIEEMALRLSDTFKGLSSERERVKAMLSSMAEGVFAVDRWGKVILANTAIERTFGIIELDIIGKTVREAIRNNEVADMVEEARNELAGVSKEISILVPIERSFIAEATPIKDVSGVFQGVVCVLHDVTDIKKLEGYRSEFVANVSHELKTPLTAIRSYVETLLNGAIDDKEHNREFLQKIDKHATNLSALIDDILEISRLESKRELPKFSRIDMGGVVACAVEDVSEKAKKKGQDLSSACEGKGITINGIEDQVYRAVMNLLDNAVNYTPSGGKIAVSCERDGDAVIISVSDSGIGIANEHLSRIFERFYRVDKGRSRDMGGTGLGLAIVKHVMNIHNGGVSVESNEGVGSTFTLSFPGA